MNINMKKIRSKKSKSLRYNTTTKELNKKARQTLTILLLKGLVGGSGRRGETWIVSPKSIIVESRGKLKCNKERLLDDLVERNQERM
jgi:hypothetical protein